MFELNAPRLGHFDGAKLGPSPRPSAGPVCWARPAFAAACVSGAAGVDLDELWKAREEMAAPERSQSQVACSCGLEVLRMLA